MAEKPVVVVGRKLPAAVEADILFNLDPRHFLVGIVDDVLQERLVHTAPAVGEIGFDDRMRLSASDQFLNFLVAHGDAEPFHFVLAYFIFDEHVKGAIALRLESLRLEHLAGGLSNLLDLGVELALILLVGDRIAIDDDNFAEGIGPNRIKNTRILKNPKPPEGDHEDPQDDMGVIPDVVHRAHTATSTTLAVCLDQKAGSRDVYRPAQTAPMYSRGC